MSPIGVAAIVTSISGALGFGRVSPVSFLYAAIFASVAIVLAVQCGRLAPPVGLLCGLAIGALVSALGAFSVGAHRTTSLLPLERTTIVRGVVTDDVFVDGRDTYRITIRPVRVGASDGTICTGSSLVAARFDIFAPLDWHLHRGRIIEFTDLVASDPGDDETLRFSAGRPTLGGFSSRAYRLRATLFAAIDALRHRLGPNAKSLFGTLFLGITDESFDDVRYFVRRAGCIHLFALSGMHVAVLIGLLRAALSPLVGRRMASIAAVPVVAAYVALIGAPPALLRAAIMFALSTLCISAGRRVRTIDIVAPAVVVGCLAQPESAATLSFQLTFLAVVGIVLGSARFTRWFRRFVPSPVASGLGVALAAYLSTAWRIATSFGVSYPFGIIASLVLGPLVAVFLIAALVVLLLWALWPAAYLIAGPVSRALELVANGFVAVARYFSRLPGIEVPWYAVLGVSLCLWTFVLVRFRGHDQL